MLFKTHHLPDGEVGGGEGEEAEHRRGEAQGEDGRADEPEPQREPVIKKDLVPGIGGDEDRAIAVEGYFVPRRAVAARS